MKKSRSNLPQLQVHMFPCLEDNYGYLVHDSDSGFTACIDTPEVDPILRALDEKGWQLTVDRMVLLGAEIPDDQTLMVVNYLAQAFPKE